MEQELERTKIWSISGINTKRQNFARCMIFSHIRARDRELFFIEFFSTINWNDGVLANETIFECQGFSPVTAAFNKFVVAMYKCECPRKPVD